MGHQVMLPWAYVERTYKEHLSGYSEWSEKEHAETWLLFPSNQGARYSIDETQLCEDVVTILSNKDAHGGKGSIVAMIAGTKARTITGVLQKLPEEQRKAVTEITMDFSESMRSIAEKAFPNATIVIDCFHIIKRTCDATEEIRLREKRQAITEQNKERADFKKKQERNRKQRKYYRKRHPKRYKGKKRGRKPARGNSAFRPATLTNGETKVELITKSKHLLSMSRDKWSDSQKKRAAILFELCPKIKEAYELVDSLRAVFRAKLTKEEASKKLHEWYQKVAECTLREVKAARDLIKSREKQVLNYFINRSTNAAAESLNSKLKRFRAQLHGISDYTFFLFRVSRIFA